MTLLRKGEKSHESQDKNPETPIFSQRKEIEGPGNQQLERDQKGFDNASRKLKEAKQPSAVARASVGLRKPRDEKRLRESKACMRWCQLIYSNV